MADADYCLSCGRAMDLEPTIYERGDLTYDNVRHRWSCGQRSVVLPPARGNLVEVMMRRGLANRSTLILHYANSENPTNLMNVQICKIRKALATLQSRMRIVTRTSVGYELIDQSETDQ